MPCSKLSGDKSPQEELKNLGTQAPITPNKAESTRTTSSELENTPTTSNEVERQNQPEIDEERETTREEYPSDQPLVSNY